LAREALRTTNPAHLLHWLRLGQEAWDRYDEGAPTNPIPHMSKTATQPEPGPNDADFIAFIDGVLDSMRRNGRITSEDVSRPGDYAKAVRLMNLLDEALSPRGLENGEDWAHQQDRSATIDPASRNS
jgi:hypothetical protein